MQRRTVHLDAPNDNKKTQILHLESAEPFSIECKNQEKINVWESYKQAAANAKGVHEPIVVIKKNGEKPLVVIDAVAFVDMVEEIK